MRKRLSLALVILVLAILPTISSAQENEYHTLSLDNIGPFLYATSGFQRAEVSLEENLLILWRGPGDDLEVLAEFEVLQTSEETFSVNEEQAIEIFQTIIDNASEYSGFADIWISTLESVGFVLSGNEVQINVFNGPSNCENLEAIVDGVQIWVTDQERCNPSLSVQDEEPTYLISGYDAINILEAFMGFDQEIVVLDNIIEVELREGLAVDTSCEAEEPEIWVFSFDGNMNAFRADLQGSDGVWVVVSSSNSGRLPFNWRTSQGVTYISPLGNCPQ